MADFIRKKRVLVADDYPDVAEVLAELLLLTASFPIEVAVAHDGAQALAKAIADRPDCAILDIDMPTLSGLDAALAIRAQLGEAAPLLLAVTGDPRHAQSKSARAAFDHFFDKPADADAILALIERARSAGARGSGSA